MLDTGKPLSKSLLWTIQRRYFEDQGIEAFRANIVPSYITSNPYIARRYAHVVLAYLRDCLPAIDQSQPVYIAELGAGGGRFAFFFLKSFAELLAASPFADLRFCYVLTDLPEQNVLFWMEHPDLQTWVQSGRLDFARFDALADSSIRLRVSGAELSADSLANPLVILANYFFDSIPQDIFHVEQGQVQECQIELSSRQPEPDPTAGDVLMRTKIFFLTQKGEVSRYYRDPDLDAILQEYRSLEDSYLLFPASAIRMLRAFKKLSGGRMLMLTGDFGLPSVSDWDHNGAPDVRIHGSISMEVNFHALGAFVKNQGGRVFFPSFYSRFLTVCAFLFGEHPQGFPDTSAAYANFVEQAGPNDFFLLKRGIEKGYSVMNLDEFLALLRISGFDPHLFLDAFDDLLEKLPAAERREQQELIRSVDRLWSNYYHLGEERDLPFNLGVILFRLGLAREAIEFFERSLQLYGPSPMTLFNLALSLSKTRRYTEAWARAKQALLIQPDFEPALKLTQELKKYRPSLAPE